MPGVEPRTVARAHQALSRAGSDERLLTRMRAERPALPRLPATLLRRRGPLPALRFAAASISMPPTGLTIAHVDCDAFYAAVEKRDHPDPRGQAGDRRRPGPRGVVSTCCYIARTFGVRSAMPMGRALALCPKAIVLPPDMAKYARVGREIRARMQELTPLVEPLSIDEAYLDLTGCEGANGAGAAETLARFARAVEAEIGVTVSVGLSYCKFLAKLASDLDKPRGFSPRSRGKKRWPGSPRRASGGCGASARSGRSGWSGSGFRLIGDLQRIDEWAAVLAPRRGRPAAVAPGARPRRSRRVAPSARPKAFRARRRSIATSATRPS